VTIKPSSKWSQVSGRARDTFLDAIKERRAAGKEVLDIQAGDPVVWGFTYQNLSRHLINIIKEGWHMYPPSSPWEMNLRNAIVQFEKKYRGVGYSPDDIIVAPGVAAVMSLLHYAILEQGDEVISWNPSHYLAAPTKYWPYIGAKPIVCKTLEEEDWKPDIDDLRKRITARTKAIFVNSPNNPTGAVYDDKVLKEIINIAGQHEIPIISDEIYGLITFGGVEAHSMPTLSKDVAIIMLSGMSKIFMRPGWRVGYMCIHDPRGNLEEVRKAIKKIAKAYGHGPSCMPTPILGAASRIYEDAVENGLQESAEMIKELERRKTYTMKRFNQMKGVKCSDPKGALYAFPRILGIGKAWKTDTEFLLDLLKEEGVMFDPGSSYGTLGESHIRTLTMPKIEILETVYNKLEHFLAKRGTA